MNPPSTKLGTSAASHGPNPSASACAMPNRGTLRCHSGWKCSVRQILPPLERGEAEVRCEVLGGKE
eukprot:12516-Eustigmatos_ZCMA.PRE.1